MEGSVCACPGIDLIVAPPEQRPRGAGHALIAHGYFAEALERIDDALVAAHDSKSASGEIETPAPRTASAPPCSIAVNKLATGTIAAGRASASAANHAEACASSLIRSHASSTIAGA